MWSRSGSRFELSEQAPARSLRQTLGTALLWIAVGGTAAVAVVLALVVAPVSEQGSASAPGKAGGSAVAVRAMAAEAAPADPAPAVESHRPATPAPAQIAAAHRDDEPKTAVPRTAGQQAAVAHSPRPAHHRRTVARGYRFQPFGHGFAGFSFRNRWR